MEDGGYRSQTYEIWYRPGLLDFLASVSRVYEVVVFSEGSKAYVDMVVRKLIDPEREYISYVLNKDHVSKYDFWRKRKGHGYTEFIEGLDIPEWSLVKTISGFCTEPSPRRPEGCLRGQRTHLLCQRPKESSTNLSLYRRCQ